MKPKWIEAADLPENEKVYLAKDRFGYRVVDPYLPGDGWVKRLFGGKRNRFICAVVIILALLFYLGVNELVDSYKAIAEAPCDYCTSCFVKSSTDIGQVNFSLLNSGVDRSG